MWTHDFIDIFPSMAGKVYLVIIENSVNVKHSIISLIGPHVAPHAALL